MNFKKCIALVAFGMWALSAQAQDTDFETYKKEQQTHWGNMGDNFIRFYPLGVQHDGSASVGLEYERLIDKKKSIGLVVPVYYSFGLSYLEQTTGYIYLSPGLKFYPALQRKVTYAVGPSLLFARGQYSEWTWVNNSERLHTVKHTIFGMMIKNYLNVNLNSSFNFSLDFGLGITYINNKKSNMNLTPEKWGPGITGSFNIGFGYRF